MENKDKIEIPFGAKDSELCECEYTIPEGYEAEIKDGKVIIRKKESEDERIRKVILKALMADEAINILVESGIYYEDVESYLEKQGKQKPTDWSEEDELCINYILCNCMNYAEAKGYVKSACNEELHQKAKDWLKSLEDRYTWKPNNEHYELEEFAKIVRGNLTGISEAVQKLFEAKYLQLTGNKMYGGFKD